MIHTKIDTNIIFLPGMMCDQRIFQPQIHYFSRFCNVEVATLTTNSIEGIAQTLLKQTAFNHFYLCGLSMGGIVAMEVQKQAPERIKGLILISTNHLADQLKRKKIRNKQLEQVSTGHLSDVIQKEFKPFYIYQKNQKYNELMQLFYSMAMDLGKNTFINQSQALKERKNYISTLARVSKPSLIICGREDPLCPPRKHLAIAKIIPKATLFIIEKCGHIVNLEHPRPTNQIIHNWLSLVT